MKEERIRILASGLFALEHDPEKCVAVFRKDHAQTITPRLSVPGVHYACNPAFVPAACPPIVNVMPGVSKAALRRAGFGDADIFASGSSGHKRQQFVTKAQPFGRFGR
ncbi:hypothetical protein [Bradyrhizobium sp. AZCC 2230]|uniref:hypothetical protein n=1 Tax=Bradyrhizobium sp. AZCC 2230 TaxID=3117021 RepID=UPI002FF4351E